MAGIEPATDGLRNRCSTAELHWRPTCVRCFPGGKKLTVQLIANWATSCKGQELATVLLSFAHNPGKRSRGRYLSSTASVRRFRMATGP